MAQPPPQEQTALMNPGAVLLLLLLLFQAWHFGFESGRRSVEEETHQRPSYWRQLGQQCQRLLQRLGQQPGTVLILLLFLAILFFRVLLFIIPALLVLLLR
ncbi:MAG TPA: hypothetical protein PKA06_15565 [Gemmatales bacterium]|nr:hypothetical protein [Gemmatales bacterium]